MARFIARMPQDLAATFSEAQLAAIDLHFGMRHRVGHLIDIRRRFGIASLQGYIILLIGRERRIERH